VDRGWYATGLLERLWSRPGWNRDKLAEATGIRGNTLSAYNTGGRRLGIVNARRIAGALGVTLLDLGAPEVPASEDPALDRLAELERQCDELRAIVTHTLRLLDLELADSDEQGLPTVRRIPPQSGGPG
jgi:transcriptional regulator with XRE-family HTH domain